MFYPVQCDQPAQVRLTVNSAQASRGWGKRLRIAGWRSFVRASGRDSSVMTCILKRGATAVMLTQSAVVAIDQTISLPPEVAGELCSLFVESGLAVPS